jgi:hypothetical protein
MPQEAVSALHRYNIRDVETLLSIISTPTGLKAISQALGWSADDTRELGQRLVTAHPDLNFSPASLPGRAFGHRPPTGN